MFFLSAFMRLRRTLEFNGRQSTTKPSQVLRTTSPLIPLRFNNLLDAPLFSI